MKEENLPSAKNDHTMAVWRFPTKNERVRAFMKRLGSSVDAGTLQIARDAEARNKPVCITYRAAFGAKLRQRLRSDGVVPGQRFMYVYFAALLYCALCFGHGKWISSLSPLYLGGAWVICLFATFYLPEDKIYLDRLNIIIPEGNPMMSAPKVLWSRVEEVAIIDVAKPGKPSKFAIKLTQVSRDQSLIFLRLLDKHSLTELVGLIKEYAPHARGLAQLNEAERFFDYEQGNIEHISYTQLWEQSCTAQFGLTSFTPLAPGQKIQERYTVTRQIAAGGFSAIYLIADEEGTSYVLKESVLPSNLDADAKAKATEQFQREATILAKLNHPQVATVYDYFVENGRNYLRLEYIDGTNMRKYVKENLHQGEAVVENWTAQLATILQYLHELSPPVVHRDLSPDNVVIRPNGRLVLIDFGAANEFIGAATGTLVGKHAYMAPEQIRGNAEPISDIYSLGACAYFALTGRDPEPLRVASATRDGAKISDWFDDFIKRSTQLDRDERFPSARSALEYLGKVKPHPELAQEPLPKQTGS